MLQLLQDLTVGNAKSDVDTESRDMEQETRPRLVAAAFVPQHLPDRVLFLTSNLPGVRCLLQFKNFYMYDSDLTIVHKEEWASGTGWMPWVSPPIPLCSLVRIRQSGNYSGSLGIVIAMSPEFGNENLIVAVVPKIPYPPISAREMDMDTASPLSGPSRKRQKVGHRAADSEGQVASQATDHQNAKSLRWAVPKATPSKPQAGLFDLNHHFQFMGRKPPVIIHDGPIGDIPSGDQTSNIGLAKFFSTPKGLEAWQRNIPPKEFSVPNEYGKTVKTTLHFDCRKLSWAGELTLPLCEFSGNFYWGGLLLMPIYCYASVDRVVISYSKEELVPFIEAQLFPSIFGRLLSQLHWKKGDKVVEVSYYEPDHHMHEAIVFKVDEVMMQQGVVRATPIQLLKRDGLQQTHTWLSHGNGVEQQHVLSQTLRKMIEDGSQECSLATHRLYLASGDHVRVVAGEHEGVCGLVIVSEGSQLSVLPKGSTDPVSLPLLFDNDFSPLHYYEGHCPP